MEKFNLNEYINILNNKNQIKEINNVENILNNIVEFISYNSKEVTSNSIFVCKGNSFKEEYLEEAHKNGATIYISEKKYNVDMPYVLVKDIKVSLSLLASKYFNNPAEKLNIIGITGTKGKSTTAYYLKYILDEVANNINKNETAIISSIDTYDGVEKFESHLTTPESLDLHRHFKNAVDSKMENLVMEVSSQALKYSRVYNVIFNYGIFLNISEDHISPVEHEDFKDYFDSKLRIFEQTNNAIINLDSDNSNMILDIAKRDSKRVITFSKTSGKADVYCYDIKKEGFNTLFRVKTKEIDEEFVLTMPGLFNIENALAAISVALDMNIEYKYIYEGLKKAKSSGRMELYSSEDKKIICIVDYAHNKLSFEKLYESTKNEYPSREIITVFGCPGKKALLRRRDLGLLAGKNSNMVYITAEDPGEEPVEKISKEIAQYVKVNTNNYEIINDREEAIKTAIEYAAKKDKETIILITGKGNETRQKIRKRICSL